MNDMLKAVAEFHTHYQVDPGSPTIPEWKVTDLRIRLLKEELEEYREAVHRGDTVEVLDALCDLAYVLMGTALAHGMGDVFDKAFAEVHRSNMSKFPGGVVTMRPDGKVIKPESWSPPKLEQFVWAVCSVCKDPINPTHATIGPALGAGPRAHAGCEGGIKT